MKPLEALLLLEGGLHLLICFLVKVALPAISRVEPLCKWVFAIQLMAFELGVFPASTVTDCLDGLAGVPNH